MFAARKTFSGHLRTSAHPADADCSGHSRDPHFARLIALISDIVSSLDSASRRNSPDRVSSRHLCRGTESERAPSPVALLLQWNGRVSRHGWTASARTHASSGRQSVDCQDCQDEALAAHSAPPSDSTGRAHEGEALRPTSDYCRLVQIRSEEQLNPVADEVSAITAVVRPILTGVLYSLKADVVAEAGGREGVKLKMLPRLRRPGDGDTGICFEYAVHDAVRRGDEAVAERIGDALSLCKVPGDDVSSILFGAEKAGSQQLIDTAADLLTNRSSLLSGSRGRPVKLKRHLTSAAAAFRKKGAGGDLPQSISGLWRADLFLGSVETDYWIGTTVKINPTALQGDRGLRVGIVPAAQGKTDRIVTDDRRNLVVCPLPYDGSFIETFYMAWEVVTAFLAADAQIPKEVSLPRPAARTVARYLADRREYPVVDVIEALGSLAQPELLRTEEESAGIVLAGGTSDVVETSAVLAPMARLV